MAAAGEAGEASEAMLEETADQREQNNQRGRQDVEIYSIWRSQAGSDSPSDDSGESSDEDNVESSNDSEENDARGTSRVNAGSTTSRNKSKSKQQKDERWFKKVEPLINHTRTVSLLFIVMLGMCLSIDEMMIRFNGRSNQTHRMKNKPISEGYKLFCVTCAHTGYVLNFTPDGRGQGNEYNNSDGDSGKISAMLMHVTAFLDEYVIKGLQFIITADNYFVYPKILWKFRQRGIGMFGTARAKKKLAACRAEGGEPGRALQSSLLLHR